MSESTHKATVAAWFEIPARNFERAVAFYEAVMATRLRPETVGPSRMAVFPYAPGGVSGAVLEAGDQAPGAAGTLVYLNCDGRLEAAIDAVKAADGGLAGPIVELPDGMGRFVHVYDSEGNRIGLHSH
jgi:predicted enzyme related to lactoylglutathione lyase